MVDLPPRSCISCGQAFPPRLRHSRRARCIAGAAIVVTGCAHVANSPFLRRRCRTVLRHARKGILDPERRVTNGLIAVNAALFAGQVASKGAVTQWGVKYAPAIAAGRWWRLISCNLLHLTWWHLGMNVLAVSNLGAACERDYGANRMMAVYSTACLASSVASYLFTSASSLGASGGSGAGRFLICILLHDNNMPVAVTAHLLGGFFGLWAMNVMTIWRLNKILPMHGVACTVALDVGINCAIAVAIPVDKWGHFGGLLGGALATYLLGPRYIKKHVVSPFAGDLSCYEQLPPMTKIFEDSPPLALFKKDWIFPKHWAHQQFLYLQADVISQARVLHGAGAEAMVCGGSVLSEGHKLRYSVARLNYFLKMWEVEPLEDGLFVITADGRLQRHTSLPQLD